MGSTAKTILPFVGSYPDYEALLDLLPLNVLTCDPITFKIDFANKPSVETLNSISEHLPNGVHGGNIIGQCIDVFHKSPIHQRELLSDASKLPHHAIIRLGDQMLDLHIDALRRNGVIRKLVLSWSVCTERERLRIMIDEMPINIMMADPKTLRINYVNKTSVKTLEAIEHTLSVNAGDMLGTCIDDFHKNPTHQRRILDDPRNLPFQSKIKLADEVLDLHVSAVLDRGGYYLGPMLIWSIITAQENLATNVADRSGSVADRSSELRSTAEVLSRSAEDASQRSASIANAAQETSGRIEVAASAAQEMSSSVREISEQISRSDAVTQTALREARDMAEVMDRLTTQANEIGNIVELINDIASQTNLLALNATIEAARANEFGKGFAVVAHEVKSLADATSKATSAIREQIHSVQSATTGALSTTKRIEELIASLARDASAIAAATEEQTSATEEIAQNVSEAALASQEISRNANHAMTVAEETGGAAATLLNLASELSDNAGYMRERVGEFLNRD